MTISSALKSPLILRTISRKFGGYKLNIAFVVALLLFFSLHHSLRNSTGQQETLADPSEVVPNETSPTDILWNGVFVNLKTEEISEDVIRAVITITGKSSIVENGTKNAIKMFTGGFNSIEDSDENFDDINEKFTDEITSAVEIVHEEVYEVIDETVLKPKTLEKLKDILQCENRSYASRIMQRGEYWVFVNYVKADHGELPCHSHITLTTQGDHIFLDNVEPLLKAWDSPVSLAIHASGYDLSTAVDSIRYLRDCGEAANLVKKWVTFHVLFHKDHIPKEIPPIEEVLSNPFNCSLPAPFLGDASLRYSANHSLKYPINLARNVAREAAMTHFIFPSDIELYPTPKLNERFLNMIAREPPTINGTNPKVFPLAVFEVRYNEVAAKNKSELQTMLKEQRAFTFHALMCPYCHNVPRVNEWIAEEDTGQLDIFTLGKRVGPHRVWEPFFIGTQDEPLFDERLTWDGKSDKMPQNYIMCLLNYDYLVLKNVFLTHKPGVKKRVADKLRDAETEKTDHLIGHEIRRELDYIYGARAGCILGNISYYTTRAPNT